MTRITNDEVEKLRLNISRRAYCEVVPLNKIHTRLDKLYLNNRICYFFQAHRLTYKEIEKIYPKIDKFREICSQLDPQGLFRNEYLDRVIFGPSQLSENAENTKLANSQKLHDRLSAPYAVSPGF